MLPHRSRSSRQCGEEPSARVRPALESPLAWAVALGALSYGALLTLAIGNRPGSTAIGAGVKAGAVVGFLVWFTADFMLYGVSNVLNLTATLIDPLLEVVPSALAGGAIAVVLRNVR